MYRDLDRQILNSWALLANLYDTHRPDENIKNCGTVQASYFLSYYSIRKSENNPVFSNKFNAQNFVLCTTFSQDIFYTTAVLTERTQRGVYCERVDNPEVCETLRGSMCRTQILSNTSADQVKHEGPL
jgi:hypothetical protein